MGFPDQQKSWSVPLIIYHAPTATKIPENQEMYDSLKPQWFDFYVEVYYKSEFYSKIVIFFSQHLFEGRVW